MTSEFPMTFVSEKPAKATKGTKRSKMSSSAPASSMSELKASKSSSNKKIKKHAEPEISNIIPLSLPAHSMASELSRMPAKKKSSQSEYPMSEFAEEQEESFSQGVSRARVFLRGTLITILASLWVAIGTGHLSSETPLIKNLRMRFLPSASKEVATSEKVLSSDVNVTVPLPSDPLSEPQKTEALQKDSVTPQPSPALNVEAPAITPQVAAKPEQGVSLLEQLDQMEAAHVEAIKKIQALKLQLKSADGQR